MTIQPASQPVAQVATIPENYGQAVWLQYVNCLNSMNILESESLSTGGMSSFQTHPSYYRFEGQVKVLAQMILPSWKDSEYENDIRPRVEKRWWNKHGYPCDHEDEEDSYFHREECREREFTIEVDAYERFGAISRLLNRQSKFPQGDRASLLP